MAQEREIKLAAPDSGVLGAILRDPRLRGKTAMYNMDTTYFDLDAYYRERHWVLRMRWENGVPIVTMKMPGDDQTFRYEWECQAQSPAEAIPQLIKQGAPEELSNIKQFKTLCSAHFTRTAVSLLRQDATIELACDRGVLIGGAKTAPVCEVELELKSGPATALLPLEYYLTLNYNLHIEPLSKFARALALTKQ
ncbi:MAG: CYTH domain-containing protein [Oscillospiraceae bacterium]|nr:CYTH domain-containing protein [Oscillospiraceae bacterium]